MRLSIIVAMDDNQAIFVAELAFLGNHDSIFEAKIGILTA
jgi:hypothetical protein